jgi:hypothetical protein
VRRAKSWNGNNGGAGSSGARGGAQRDLQLRLAPPGVGMERGGGGNDGNGSSSPSSCVTSDSSPDNRTPMLIGTCSRCMMYCMVSMKEFPTCVNCKQPTLVDIFHGPAAAAAIAAKKHAQGK